MGKHALIATGIFSRIWWIATGQRVLYTMLAAVIPFALKLAGGEVSVLYVLSLTGFAAVFAFVTALARLPETEGAQVPLWRAIAWRLVRQAGQTLAAAVVAYQLVEEVPWADTFQALGGVLLVTLLRTLLDSLPESSAPDPVVDGDRPA